MTKILYTRVVRLQEVIELECSSEETGAVFIDTTGEALPETPPYCVPSEAGTSAIIPLARVLQRVG